MTRKPHVNEAYFIGYGELILIVFGSLIAAFVVFAVIFVLIPIIYRYSYVFQRNLLFLNFVNLPVDFKNPSKVLAGAQNVYVKTDDNVTIGMWHILPNRLLTAALLKGDTLSFLNNGEPIFLYMHGNSGNRGTSHRVSLYKILQANNFHVVAFDYRSYGDSSAVDPTETGVVNDTKNIYYWIKKRSGSAKIFFWGHSLGSGIASHALDILEREKQEISGLVLESPFNNLCDEIRSYPLARFFKYLPWFDYFFTQPAYENGFKFETDVHLSNVSAPIMILHAEDDVVIPVALGEKLRNSIEKARNESRSNSPIVMHKFPKSEGLGHKFINKSELLPSYIRSFVKNSLEYKRS